MSKMTFEEIKKKVQIWLDKNQSMGKYHPEFATLADDEKTKSEIVELIAECLDQKWNCGNTYGNDLTSAFLNGDLNKVCNYIELKHSQYIWLVSCAIYNIGTY